MSKDLATLRAVKILFEMNPTQRVCHFNDLLSNDVHCREINNEFPTRISIVGHGTLGGKYGASSSESQDGFDVDEFTSIMRNKLLNSAKQYPEFIQSLKHINLIGCNVGVIHSDGDGFAHIFAKKIKELEQYHFKIQVNAVTNHSLPNPLPIYGIIISVLANHFFSYALPSQERYFYFLKNSAEINQLILQCIDYYKSITQHQRIESEILKNYESKNLALDYAEIAYVDLINTTYLLLEREQSLKNKAEKLGKEIFSLMYQYSFNDSCSSAITQPSVFARSQQNLQLMIGIKNWELHQIIQSNGENAKELKDIEIKRQFFCQAMKFLKYIRYDLCEVGILNSLVKEVLTIHLNHAENQYKYRLFDVPKQLGTPIFGIENHLERLLESDPRFNVSEQAEDSDPDSDSLGSSL